MLELGAGADILRAIGWLYLCLIAVLVGVALWFPQRWWQKAIGMLVVLLVFMGPAYFKNRERSQQVDAQKARYAVAKALFDERCKTAGEKIYRTVDGVDGLLLTALRPIKINDASQYDTDDQYGYNVGGEDYLRYYLIGSSDLTSRYRFIEAPTTGGKFRFTTPLSAAISHGYWTKGGGRVPIEAEVVDSFSARYSVEWKDISEKVDRDHWIAGGSLRIADRKTGEVLGERIGYLFETGMGNTTGQRSPWSWARYYATSCPNAAEHNRVFVEKVLKPIQGEKK